MKHCFILSTQGEEIPTVYKNLLRLMTSIGRIRQYQTFRRALAKDKAIRVGDMTIKKAILITSTRDK